MWLERLIREFKPPNFQDWRSWLDSPNDLLLVAAGIFVVVFLLFNATRSKPKQQERRKHVEEELVRAGNNPLLKRLLWIVKPPADLMRVDGLTLDRTEKRSHALWIGPTGAGKSASVTTVRCDGKRPIFAAMPDLSDPLRAKADFVWTAGESSEPVDFLIGTSTQVAGMLTEVFRSGGNGVWKRAAYLATKQVIDTIDAGSEQRSLLLIGKRLEEAIALNRSLKMACEGWVVRFLATAEALGDSAGPGGVDIAELLQQGLNVVIDNDAWKNPGLKGDVVAFGLAEARRCADLVDGGFRLIFEEADQLGDRMDLADPFFTAGRRRRVAVDALVHSEDRLPSAMQTNAATRIYFRPNKAEHRKSIATALTLPEKAIDAIPDYHAIIEHDGKIRRLVKFPKPSKTTLPSSYETRPIATQPHTTPVRRTVIQEISSAESLPGLPPPALKAQEILNRIDRSGHCHLWLGPKDKDGYGYATWNGNNRGVHRIVWELAYGFLPTHDADGNKLEIDHQCRVRHCVRLDHLELVTKSENSKRRWRVRGVGTPA